MLIRFTGGGNAYEPHSLCPLSTLNGHKRPIADIRHWSDKALGVDALRRDLSKHAIILAIMLATSACITTKLASRKPEPGYLCALEERGEFGLVSANFELSLSAGWRSLYLRWDARDGTFANPWITAAWYRRPDGRFEIANGYVSIMRHIWDPKRRPLDLRLHLRSVAGPPRFAGSVVAGDFQRSSGPYHLRTDWSEVAALARGSTQLHLVAVDREHRVVDDAVIDGTIFERATPHVEAAMRDLEAMIANPSRACTFVDDLGTDDIVVT